MCRIVLKTDLMVCGHIEKTDYPLINQFQLVNQEGGFLAEYLKQCALSDEEQSIMRTYLVLSRDKNELAGYFSLKAGFVAARENRHILNFGFDSIPAVELANFAINGTYRANHPTKGLGAYVFASFILPIIEDTRKYIGIDIRYIFALPHKPLIQNYQKYGFVRLNRLQENAMHRRIRPNYDKSCIFMYYQL